VQRTKLLASTGFRLVAWYVSVFGLSAAILLGAVYWIALSAVEQQMFDSIEREVRLLTGVYDTRGLDALERAVHRRIGELASPRRYYLLQDAGGGRIAGNLPNMEPFEAVRVVTLPRKGATPSKAPQWEQTDSMLAHGRRMSGGNICWWARAAIGW
jgi:hypothetical protein